MFKSYRNATLLVPVSIGLLLLVGPSPSAQTAIVPPIHGQWAGPYTMQSLANDDMTEIAHAAVLPPDSAGTTDRVLFIPRKPDCGLPGGNVAVYIWRPNRPTLTQKIVDPASPDTGSEDAFCSGHNFLPDGTLAIVGGLNMQDSCTLACADNGLGGQPYGHLAVRRFNAFSVPPAFMPSSSMKRERWYPSAIGLEDGDLFIAGHGELAEPNAPPPDTAPCPPLHAEANFQTFDRFDWMPPSLVAPAATTISRKFLPGCGSSDPLVGVGNYPRIHLLSTGEIFQTNTTRAQFLDVKTPICASGSRWEISTTTIAPVVRHGGNSVHIIFKSPDSPPGTYLPADVIYAIGGTEGNDDDWCDPGGDVYSNVAKIVEPSMASTWVGSAPGQSPPPLSFARYDHNSVLLLDGSILVNGGADGVNCATLSPALPPERYYPPELFNIVEGSADDIWHDLTPSIEGQQRRYHSVAGLLPDGRVFSAGGNVPASAWNSVSIYSPGYCFVARPEIQMAPTVVNYPPLGLPFEIEVTLTAENSDVERVALVRNGSITHAWDMNQRYVVLDAAVVASSGSNVTIQVKPPVDGFMAPPGYYLLTVVEHKHYSPPPALEPKIVPSDGWWIRIE